MNKILGYISIFAGALLCASCESDELPTPVKPLAIASQNIAFTSVGGTGNVVVGVPSDGDTISAVKAVTDADWATVTVSGRNIIVQAKENPELTSRAASLKIYSGSDSVSTSITQLGITFAMKAKKEYLIDDAQMRARVDIDHSLAFEIVSAPAWITAESDESGFTYTVAENKTGAFREDYIKVKSGNATDSIFVAQGELADLVGQIYLTGYNSKYTVVSLPGVIAVDEEGNASFSCEDLGITYPFTWNQATHTATFKAAELLGTYAYDEQTTLNIFPVFIDLQVGALSYQAGEAFDAQFHGVEGGTTSDLNSLGTFNNTTDFGLGFYLFQGDEPTPNTATNLSLYTLLYPSFIKLAPNESKANIAKYIRRK